MAILIPGMEVIENQKVKPTRGELHLLKFLQSNLTKHYEVYFQPFINGDRPDIIIMRKNSGVMIIEVKDWELRNYSLDSKKNWKLKSNSTDIKSPISQVLAYKENLFTLHIDQLLEKRIRNPKMFSIISCAVYFHRETSQSLYKFLTNNFEDDFRYKKFLNYFDLLGRDSLTKKNFDNILYRRWLNRYSKLFDNQLYQSFKKFLSPPLHTIEQGKELSYTPKQQKLIVSKPKHQKIKGVAGCGKTFVLAKRAVNSHRRIKCPVLILTYNITLKNYIHDLISDVKEEFNWGNFYINNYHNFITAELNNLGIPIHVPDHLSGNDLNTYLDQTYYSNVKIFEKHSNKINKYHAIFVDEIQDYKSEWIKIIREYFLHENGEFVVFGDEKQNIYGRELDAERKPNTGIIGAWNVLNESFRFTHKIADLALNFQKDLLFYKYDIDQPEMAKSERNKGLKEHIEYFFEDDNFNEKKLISRILEYLKKMQIHPNDICCLASKIETLREIDFAIRKQLHHKTKTMFETKEMREHLEKKLIQPKMFEREIKRIRHHKKLNFWMNFGTIKLSTIHSFKGWEIHTLILLIENETPFEEFSTAELIYTGLTRCRSNLIIFNLGNQKYHNFFSENITNPQNAS